MTELISTKSPFTPALIEDVQSTFGMGVEANIRVKREAPINHEALGINALSSTVVQPETPAVKSSPQSLQALVDNLTQLLAGEFNLGRTAAFLSGLESRLPAGMRDAELEAQTKTALALLKKPGANETEVAAVLKKIQTTFTNKLDAAANSNDIDRSISLMVQMLILLLKMAIDSREANKQLRDINVRAVAATIIAQAEKLKTQAIATAITAAATFVISVVSAAITFKSAGYSRAAAKEGVNLRNQNKQLEQTQKIASRSTGNGKAELDQSIDQQKASISQSADIKDVLMNKAQTGSATANAIAAGAQSINAASGAANSFVESSRKLDEANTQQQQNEQAKSAENRDYFEKLLAQVLEMLKQILGSEAQIFKNLSSR